MFTLRFDMRLQQFGASAVAAYRAATEMCSWAESRGCVTAVLCEHHGSDDGYLPTPLILGAAIAAKTTQLMLSLVVILPLYDPVRLAEEMAVLDIISDGRAFYVFGLGYRPEEFEHFGLNLSDRGRLADEKLALVKELLAGGQVVHRGRRIDVTPAWSHPGGPTLMWGGASVAAARRAGKYGVGLLANGSAPGMAEAYAAACSEHGHQPGAVLIPDRDTPTVCFVADDLDEAWDELGGYLLHDAQAYAQWNPGNLTSAGITVAGDVAELRAKSTSHVILSVAEAIARVRAGEILNLSPLCGGVPPEIAWPYLKRVGDVVIPEASRSDSDR